ncbi:hypothetical protein HPB47_000721 [Ixodes persulcatus]|uniref:Uncharacterized protein n=1 Tax=Ixodes persulcatus TaxID=34615 RepID=A0AC60PR86_IXOPE|nr:hypothetical protein HPB47_000721 [Ixodes persulcatus]
MAPSRSAGSASENREKGTIKGPQREAEKIHTFSRGRAEGEEMCPDLSVDPPTTTTGGRLTGQLTFARALLPAQHRDVVNKQGREKSSHSSGPKQRSVVESVVRFNAGCFLSLGVVVRAVTVGAPIGT